VLWMTGAQGFQVKSTMLQLAVLILLATAILQAQDSDSTPHTTQFVTVEQDVKLEVVDWGGSGRPLVFLAGLGNDAHVFDKFAPKFTANHHVYGITRRGFGASSKPAPANGNYAADRLGDDVLAVIDSLHLIRPILVGHSVAGEELSSIGSRHPDKVAGLIYLDAANGYAYYDRVNGDIILDTLEVKHRIDELEGGTPATLQFEKEMLSSVSQLQRDLQESVTRNAYLPDPPSPAHPSPPPPVIAAIVFGTRKYSEIRPPILAIFACPHKLESAFRDNPTAKSQVESNDLATCSAKASALRAGIPSAQVVLVPNADHYVFNSNEEDVLREMNVFLEKLP
jgi:pimeloyl-ACP methyl ester carboxylesterase